MASVHLEGPPQASRPRAGLHSLHGLRVIRPDVQRAVLLPTALIAFGIVVGILLIMSQARQVFLPVILALLLQRLFAPGVHALGRLGIRPLAASALIVVGVVGTCAYAGYRLAGPALEWTQELPAHLSTIEYKLGTLKEPVEQVTRATEQVEDIASVSESEASIRVVPLERGRLIDRVLTGARETFLILVLTTVLLFFLLSSEDQLLRKVVSAMPRFSQRRSAVRAMRDARQRLTRYLATITMINVALGCTVATALYFLDMPNPFLWGALAAMLNFIPYLGTTIGVATVALAALVSFENPGQALLAPLAYLVLSAIEGMLITPLLLGLRFRLAPVAIVLWLMLWTFMWGLWGALIAVPLLVSLKIVADNVPALAPVARVLDR